ncbi:MAG TPA: head GIN domain-containing protein [Flavobacterium sp.]|jgi:hypothetical protein
MKKAIFLLCILSLFCGCGLSEDCIKSSGTVKTREVETLPFTKIFVYPGVNLVLSQGSEQSVTIQAGENFIADVEVASDGETLSLRDNSGCNWVRGYGETTVFVTAPDVIEIYSNTDRKISSSGVLTYPILRLFAMDIFDGIGTGDFHLEVDNQQLVIASNNISAFFIKGRTNEMLLNFYDDMGRFEGADFVSDSIKVFQRSSNDMIVHPVYKISGDIYSTGDIISKTHPADVQVIEHYTGRLIYD